MKHTNDYTEKDFNELIGISIMDIKKWMEDHDLQGWFDIDELLDGYYDVDGPKASNHLRLVLYCGDVVRWEIV